MPDARRGMYQEGMFEVLAVVAGAGGRFGRPAPTRVHACLPRARDVS